jgi:hypothetical protein
MQQAACITIATITDVRRCQKGPFTGLITHRAAFSIRYLPAFRRTLQA